jgi:DNA polymerase
VPTLFRDYETRSIIDLRKAGAYQYASHPATDVWCCAFAVDDGEIKLWVPGDDVPPEFTQAAHNAEWFVSSFNDQFERLIERHIMAPRFGWPEIPLERHRCSQAAALALALPASLEGAAKALGLEQQKDNAGRRLMLQMARPRKPRADENPNNIVWFDDVERRTRLYDYCKQDVATERTLHDKILPLIPDEQKLWELDQRINDRGVFLDGGLIDAALSLEGKLRHDIDAEIAAITGGAVQSSQQVAKLLAWLAMQGCEIEKLGKAGLETLLTNGVSNAARRVIELRLAGAHAAAKKLARMREWRGAGGRARGVFKYCGAATGRWTSFGIQLQNLKRPTVKDLGAAIEVVASGDVDSLRRQYPRPMGVLGDISRAVLRAAPGHRFIAADFSGVESRITAWLSGQQSKIDQWTRFDASGDPNDEPYLILGRKLGVDEQHARTIGKTADLAFGYMGGVPAWKKLAPPGDMSSDTDIKRYQRLWRAENSEAVLFWRKLNNRAIKAVRRPNISIPCGQVRFECDGTFLFMTLPSGRKLSYPFARVETEGRRDPVVVFKDNAKGKWADCRDGDGAYGGTWTENAVQAVARDIFAAALVRLEAAGYPVVLHVHDEIVAEVPDGFGSADEFLRILTARPDWADGMPIAAKVREGPRFCKINASPRPAEPVTTNATPEPILEDLPWEEAPAIGNTDMFEGHPHASNGFGTVGGYPHGEREWGADIADYVYRDKDGNPYLRVKRTSAKQFPQYHWDNGRWKPGAPKARIPYRLPELLAAKPDEPVFVCEGEKDADNVAALGLIATTNPGGAGKWTAELNSWFQGKTLVYLLEDNDDAGRAHVRKVAASLRGTVPDTRIVSFPELPEKGDVSDWLDQGHTKQELLDRAKAAPRAVPAAVTGLQFARMDEVEAKHVEWLWQERLARGKLTLLAGEPGIGKSQISIDIAARISKGGRWPDGNNAPSGSVVILSAEDSADDTLRPRLEAAGAALDRTHVLKATLVEGKPVTFSLQVHLEMLGAKLTELGDATLIIIDPITSYMGKIDGHQTVDVRTVLEPLAAFAEKHDVAVLAISHPPKASQSKALHAVTGSLAFVAAARMVFIATKEPQTDRRLLLPVKNNLGPLAAGLGFSLEQRLVGNEILASHVIWDSAPVTTTADEAVAAASNQGATAMREAVDFLREELSTEARPAQDIRNQPS